jgi:hypothetical protein
MSERPDGFGQAVTGWLRDAADRLGLRDWVVEVSDDPCEEGSYATVTCTSGARHATVKLAADFHDEPLPLQRQVLVHELLHCHLDALSSIVTEDLDGQVAPAVLGVVSSSFERQLEFATDAIAVAIAPSFPLPTWEGSDG